jgi:hypothetical protein
MVRAQSALVVGAPLVAVATLMIGLRVGAGESFRAAAIYAAPRAKGSSRLAWQVLTYLEDRGVREVVPIADLRVVARSGARESRWTGASNVDGIAEIDLDLEGDAIEVTIASGEEPLGAGRVLVPPGRGAVRASERVLPFSKREGAIAIDLIVEGERLVIGYPSTAWAHVSREATLSFDPEPGLVIASTKPPACDGWAELSLVAHSLLPGLRVDARAGNEQGVWYGSLPASAGAFGIGLPRAIAPKRAESAVLVAPNPRTVVYAEIDDEQGRLLGAALPVTRSAEQPTPRATLAIPPLEPGLYWLVASGEPRGAETMGGATMARAFRVTENTGEPACTLGPWLARHPAPGFPRVLAFDGVETRGASNRARHRLGLAIGLGSLFVAAVLEVLLLTAASREARELLARAEESDASERMTRRSPGGGLAIAVLVALLGFALLAALMIAKA